MGRKYGEKIGMSYCHGLGGNQVFAYTKRQQIMSDDLCLDASAALGPVNMVRCHNMGGNQEWVYDADINRYDIAILVIVCKDQHAKIPQHRCYVRVITVRVNNG
ncbi:hypothetical protein DOY81_012252 [Sarcophaga bullata]|nr:hypothetical protein DOY81_012252 [Sarcophaga bullata]